MSNPGVINDRREGDDRNGVCEFCDAILRVRSRHCALYNTYNIYKLNILFNL